MKCKRKQIKKCEMQLKKEEEKVSTSYGNKKGFYFLLFNALFLSLTKKKQRQPSERESESVCEREMKYIVYENLE